MFDVVNDGRDHKLERRWLGETAMWSKVQGWWSPLALAYAGAWWNVDRKGSAGCARNREGIDKSSSCLLVDGQAPCP